MRKIYDLLTHRPLAPHKEKLIKLIRERQLKMLFTYSVGLISKDGLEIWQKQEK